jgi:hypothetical protein
LCALLVTGLPPAMVHRLAAGSFVETGTNFGERGNLAEDENVERSRGTFCQGHSTRQESAADAPSAQAPQRGRGFPWHFAAQMSQAGEFGSRRSSGEPLRGRGRKTGT